MKKKLFYEKPQSEEVRLPAPVLLAGGSGPFGEEPGVWDELLHEPEVFDDFVFTPDDFGSLL